MTIALSDFEAFSNFASFEEIKYYIENITTLKNLFHNNTLNEYY